MILDVPQQDRPLCPNNENPRHPLHTLHNQLIDAAYENTEHNEDAEAVNSESEKINAAVANGRHDGKMYLYKDSVIVHKHQPSYVVAYYFRCLTCGLIIPAVGLDFK